MELMKKNIHMNKLICKSNLQTTFDQDVNVPDTKADILRIIRANGEIRLEEQKVMNGKLYLNGNMRYDLLYLGEDTGVPVHSIRGDIPLEEVINMEDSCNGEGASVVWEIEDFKATAINSRKFNIKALVHFIASVEGLHDEIAAVGLTDSDGIESCSRKIELTSLAVSSKDTYRFRDEIALPSGKGDLREILYCEVELKNLETRLLDEKFNTRGEMAVFFLYLADSEDTPLDCYETELPFTASLDCSGCSEEMIPDISFHIVDRKLEIRPDADGEERMVGLEVALSIDIKVYEEEQLEVLEDIYSPSLELTPLFQEAEYETLLARNASKLRVSDRLKIEMNHPRILQVCHANGNVKLDEAYPVDQGLQADGVIDVTVFYFSADDSQPLQSLHTTIPYSQLIEIRNMEENIVYDVKPIMDQISIMMLDAEELEIKATVTLQAMVFKKQKEAFLVDFTEEPLNMEKLQAMPGMTGYIVKEGDTLWNIAKRYYTTAATIANLNELELETLRPGDQLLIIKEAAAML